MSNISRRGVATRSMFDEIFSDDYCKFTGWLLSRLAVYEYWQFSADADRAARCPSSCPAQRLSVTDDLTTEDRRKLRTVRPPKLTTPVTVDVQLRNLQVQSLGLRSKWKYSYFWSTPALNPERRSARKSKTTNSRLASLASNPLVFVPILGLWAQTG